MRLRSGDYDMDFTIWSQQYGVNNREFEIWSLQYGVYNNMMSTIMGL